jgi:hypothetical protein
MSFDDARELSIKFVNSNHSNQGATIDHNTMVEVTDKLIKDHYLEKNGGQLRWRHDVLRRIWVNRRGLDN